MKLKSYLMAVLMGGFFLAGCSGPNNEDMEEETDATDALEDVGHADQNEMQADSAIYYGADTNRINNPQ